MRAIKKAGFDGMELSMPDLLSYGANLEKRPLAEDETDVVVEVAEQVKNLADELGLKIVMLQPFSRFEGWTKNSSEREFAFDRAESWFKIMAAVGTDMLQVRQSLPSEGLPALTSGRLDHLTQKTFPRTSTTTPQILQS